MGMDESGAPRESLARKLQRIDRRILYMILFIVVGLPTIWPVNIPNAVDPMSRALWETIDRTPPGKVVLISSTWTKSTRGENKGQEEAILHHLMSRRIPFVLSAFTPQGTQVAQNLINEIAPLYHYRYGVDWISLGYQANAASFVKGINVDFVQTVKQDSVEKKPLQSFPIMSKVRNIDDIHIVVEISASASQMTWIQFNKPGIAVGFCPTSVMAPEAIPYCTSGQLAGMLWGAKGAYDYEQLNAEHHICRYASGRQYMGPLSAAFALVILSIVVGNVAMFAERRANQGAGPR